VTGKIDNNKSSVALQLKHVLVMWANPVPHNSILVNYPAERPVSTANSRGPLIADTLKLEAWVMVVGAP
jgi:hypothetical protein